MKDIIILGIESSCDDTTAAVVRNGFALSNIMISQEVHRKYGGVVPELASRAHQQNIIPVVDYAMKQACVKPEDLSAIAFTVGPGLMGSLLVGTSFAKGLALSLDLPLIEVNHLHAHIMAHFINKKDKKEKKPSFPFLCLLISGGHTQLVVMEDFLKMRTIGKTIDDAAGEAFDKCAKSMGLPYPGGPEIDRLALRGDYNKFQFAKPQIPNLNFSFSGLKTSFLYFLRDRLKEDLDFIQKNQADLAASIQHTIISSLMDKLIMAARETGIRQIGVAGGVSANKGLRRTLEKEAKANNWDLFVPDFQYTTDNAAMIAIAGYHKYLSHDFTDQSVVPQARIKI